MAIKLDADAMGAVVCCDLAYGCGAGMAKGRQLLTWALAFASMYLVSVSGDRHSGSQDSWQPLNKLVEYLRAIGIDGNKDHSND